MRNLKIKFLALTLLCVGSLSAQEAEPEFEIVRQDEKVTLYERWIFFPGTTIKSRQIKGVFHTNTTLNRMLQTLTDEALLKEWQRNLIEHKLIHKSDSAWSTYSLYHIPWPLTNQDYLLNYFLKENSDKRIVVWFNHFSNDALEPVRENVDRKPMIGQWEFEKLSNGKIKVTYTVTSEPVSYPRFVTDRIVRNNLLDTMNTLIAVAEKK